MNEERKDPPSDDLDPQECGAASARERDDIFGDVIYSYTRAEAIADGVLHDVSEPAREAGITFPTAVTARLWAEYIEPPAELEGHGQSASGRLWDVLWMFRTAAKHSAGESTLHFEVLFLLSDRRLHKIRLKAVCGPGDTLEPVITIMLPEED